MAHVHFTRNLLQVFPNLSSMEVEADSVRKVVDLVNQRYPGIANYIVDETGGLRQHVNIFVGGKMIRDRIKLTDALNENSEVHIIQALSGG